MPGIARAVIPGIAHHVTQRGNRGEDIFFEDEDEGMLATIRLHTRTGCPAGDKRLVSALESRLGRRLLARSIGRPRKGKTKALRKG